MVGLERVEGIVREKMRLIGRENGRDCGRDTQT